LASLRKLLAVEAVDSSHFEKDIEDKADSFVDRVVDDDAFCIATI